MFFPLDNLYLYYRKHESDQNPERTGQPNPWSQLPIGSLGKDFSSVAALRSHISWCKVNGYWYINTFWKKLQAASSDISMLFAIYYDK